jgi:hypothetical protein
MLRRGNHSSAKFWRRVLLPVIERYRTSDIPRYFRGDAAFAIPALYILLENESFQYTIRIPADDVLMTSISHLLTRPVGRPLYKPKVFQPVPSRLDDRRQQRAMRRHCNVFRIKPSRVAFAPVVICLAL